MLILTRAAELLDSLPSADDEGSDTDIDSPMSDAQPPRPILPLAPDHDVALRHAISALEGI